ncbi:MAG: sigma-70 family RNA polymerase sigma factor [candidate division KSB1 bacterium]|nr:sigma-70 family RNA polymerase sigma factor [candidate division KSB1 bacterium]
MQLLSDEQEIVRRSREGDVHAFRMVYEAYKKPLFTFIYRMTGNRHDAEDLLQDVFVKAYRRLRSFEERSCFSTWLFSIAKHETVSFLRKTARRNGLRNQLEEKAGWENDVQVPLLEDPEGEVLGRETEAVLQGALGSLPESYRAAFILGVIEGLPYEEVGQILGCSVANVKSRVFRARARLARWLARYYPEFGPSQAQDGKSLPSQSRGPLTKEGQPKGVDESDERDEAERRPLCRTRGATGTLPGR